MTLKVKPNEAEPQANPNSLTQTLSQRDRDLRFFRKIFLLLLVKDGKIW